MNTGGRGKNRVIVQFFYGQALELNAFHFSLHLIHTAFLQSSCHLHPNYFARNTGSERCHAKEMMRK